MTVTVEPFATASAPMDVGQALSLLERRLTPPLVEAAQRRQVADAVRDLPAAWRWAMVECRLASDDDRIDVMVCTTARERPLFRSGFPLPRPLRHTADLLVAWAKPIASLRRVPLIWFEWDLPDRAERPLVSVCMNPHFLTSEQGRGFQLSTIERVVSDTLELASHGSGDSQVVRRVVACARMLPHRRAWLHFAPLAARRDRGCRVTVALPQFALLDWLRRIGWPGDFARADRLLSLAVAPWHAAVCQIEVDATVRPYLAVETRTSSIGFPERRHRSALLSSLVHEGRVDPNKARAALRWPSRHGEQGDFSRSAYFKLILATSGAIEAKAYLGFSCRPAR